MTATTAQRGQVLVFVALVLTLVLLPLAAYAVDAAIVAGASSRLQGATAEAAMLAAQQIDVQAFRSTGELRVDEVAARAAATGLLDAEAPGAALTKIQLAGSRLTIVTSLAVKLPIAFLSERSVVLRAVAAARLAEGYDRPSSRLPLPTSTF